MPFWLLVIPIIATVLLVYTTAVLFLGFVVSHFWDRDTAETVVAIPLLPFKLARWAVDETLGRLVMYLVEIATRPWSRKRFREIFSLPPDSQSKSSAQVVVNTKLSLLAREMDKAFERERAMLKRRKSGERIDMRHWSSEAQQTKTDFWRAHRLARRFGFRVLISCK